MIEIKINGEVIECEEGESLLKVCRQNGIDVPSICYHDSLKPFGACGVCKVSVSTEDAPDKKKIVSSCVWKTKAGQIVETENDEVNSARADAVKKLLAAAPGSLPLQAFADFLGVNKDEVETIADSGECIKCGLCVRVCQELIGLDWGWKRKDYPRDLAPPDGCIGCLSCANVCPTDCIEYEYTDDTVTIWGKSHEIQKCTECGVPVMPKEQVEWLTKKGILPGDYFDLCEECKRKKVATTQAELATY